jgi:hypothetical protein
MRGKPSPAIFFLSLLCITALETTLEEPADAVDQPIQYNHYKHTQELELECVMCHSGVRELTRATIPGVETCIGCHSEAVTESTEEEKIRQYYERNEEIPWQRLFKVPDHVYFSHRRHVKVAGLDCTKCHGDMAMRTKPPKKAPMKITMNACLSCHRELGAKNDCVSCHR